MNQSVFPGYPAYLEAAGRELGRPGAVGPARRVSTLAALANLCAQAACAGPGVAAGILAEAEAFADQLRVACRAGELMLADVRAGCGPAGRDSGSPRGGAFGGSMGVGTGDSGRPASRGGDAAPSTSRPSPGRGRRP